MGFRQKIEQTILPLKEDMASNNFWINLFVDAFVQGGLFDVAKVKQAAQIYNNNPENGVWKTVALNNYREQIPELFDSFFGTTGGKQESGYNIRFGFVYEPDFDNDSYMRTIYYPEAKTVMIWVPLKTKEISAPVLLSFSGSKKFYETLKHELTHAIDIIRADIKNSVDITDLDMNSYNSDSEEENNKKYFNNSMEIHAFISGLIDIIDNAIKTYGPEILAREAFLSKENFKEFIVYVVSLLNRKHYNGYTKNQINSVVKASKEISPLLLGGHDYTEYVMLIDNLNENNFRKIMKKLLNYYHSRGLIK